MATLKANNPARHFNDVFMPRSFGLLMDEFFPENRGASSGVFSPKADIAEDEKGFSIELVLPGLKKEDIHMEVHQNALSIRGERTFQKEENGKKYHRIESSYGNFKRTFNLPDHVDSEGIDARFEDGILHVFLPKSEKMAPKTIAIK